MTSIGEVNTAAKLTLAINAASTFFDDWKAELQGTVILLTDEYQREFVITVKEMINDSTERNADSYRPSTADIATDFVVASSRYAEVGGNGPDTGTTGVPTGDTSSDDATGEDGDETSGVA